MWETKFGQFDQSWFLLKKLHLPRKTIVTFITTSLEIRLQKVKKEGLMFQSAAKSLGNNFFWTISGFD